LRECEKVEVEPEVAGWRPLHVNSQTVLLLC
jgi:hypothetical protein